MMPRLGFASQLLALASLLSFTMTSAQEAETDAFHSISRRFQGEMVPLIERYCLGCHDAETKKGELDLERFGSIEDVRGAPDVWQKVHEQLAAGEMPPEAKPQPIPEERRQLMDWVNDYLDAEARAGAGDPGPVVLRRLSNAEYTYTVRDLTALPKLDPAKEFPEDSAAGEGFTNAGSALVMSPALLEKYLEAGKEIAAHAVLLPNGFGFSAGTTRRDWTNEIVEQIRSLYQSKLGGQGIDFSYRKEVGDVQPRDESDGRLNLTPYFEALIAHRDRLNADIDEASHVAREEKLNETYFAALAVMLTDNADHVPLFEMLRRQWRSAGPGDADALSTRVRTWQDALWRFNPVGHLGAIKPWQESVTPLEHRRDFSLKLKAVPDAAGVTVSLQAATAGDGAEFDVVVWENPRIERTGFPAVALRDVRAVAAGFEQLKRQTLAQMTKYLDAAFEEKSAPQQAALPDLAEKHQLDAAMLESLLAYLGLRPHTEVSIREYLTHRMERIGGYDGLNGWTLPGVADLSLLGNASDTLWRIPGEAPPHAIVLHPRPERWVAAGWKSPFKGSVEIEAKVEDRHGGCGNGVSWSLQQRRGDHRRVLAAGEIHAAGKAAIDRIPSFPVLEGDLISIVIGARDGNHACDLTEIDLSMEEVGREMRTWSLSGDCTPDILAGNPHADGFGNADVWHFYTGLNDEQGKWQAVPASSLLARWLEATDVDTAGTLAGKIQELLTSPLAADVPAPDAELREQLTRPGGPLFSRVDFTSLAALANGDEIAASPFGLDRDVFEANGDLIVKAPSVHTFQVPAGLFDEATFLVSGILHESSGDEGSVQMTVGFASTGGGEALIPGVPVTVREGTAAERRVSEGFAAFRELFPAAMCYARIVPIDEVVTLVLFHREDEPLVRLMLSEAESRQLDTLWEELRFVSQDALQIVAGLEQILEYATQDADPSKFYPLREPIAKNAEAFRKQLIESEPLQFDSLVDFAGRAYRRALTNDEIDGLRDLYDRLREEGSSHDEAFRLSLARVFASPAFLYRAEEPAPGADQAPVSGAELATRLSYFLWSSGPDAELLRLANEGRLRDEETLLAQTRRLLKDARIRRLAVEFACQWLHVRDFDQLDEKSERHFPDFLGLRASMYEETIRFFTDLFQNNGSILSILEADHTFVDGSLARFYGIASEIEDWRRVDGIRRVGRGGILGMATTLAKQSGASRTSPILRGNWISETLLGEKLPKPPKNVPVLPESVPAGLSERELIERHSSDPACAKCHARIDPYGFALENYDGIGRRRELAENGESIDSKTALVDGTELEGIEGLRRYLVETRRTAFVRQFSRKLLGYALGRRVLLSDEPLLDEMAEALETGGYVFGAAVETIVRSRQFRDIRGRESLVRGER